MDINPVNQIWSCLTTHLQAENLASTKVFDGSI